MENSKLKQLILKALVNAGKDIPIDSALNFMTSELGGKISDKFSDDEIVYVFDKGTYGAYGEYRELSNVVFYKWFETFAKSDAREKLFPKLKLTEKTKPTAEEQYEMSKQYVIDAFTEYKAKLKYEDKFNICYDFLKKYEYLNIADELMAKYMSEAAEIVKSKASMDKVERRMSEIRFVELLEKLQSGKLGEQTTIANKIALEAFFKGLVETDTDITEIFNS